MIKPEHIDTIYIADKINSLPGRFRQLMQERRYPAAKYCYDTAVTLSVFLELPEAERIKLFGNRPYAEDGEEIRDGLFPEELVQRAYLECAVKRNLGRESMPYRHPLRKTG